MKKFAKEVRDTLVMLLLFVLIGTSVNDALPLTYNVIAGSLLLAAAVIAIARTSSRQRFHLLYRGSKAGW